MGRGEALEDCSRAVRKLASSIGCTYRAISWKYCLGLPWSVEITTVPHAPASILDKPGVSNQLGKA